ncbi:hypothetical protein GCM10010502_02940 [Kitasatospora aureofaciens]|uniref:Uncharacterized protein n=1 Tax=Kitasatospora aureofaciens TaxID=1894 RepID=A0A8H9HHF5_KITAU|nr:hypothetical protein GCM10010502_02940 [Kitasatospora aureofaciens]
MVRLDQPDQGDAFCGTLGGALPEHLGLGVGEALRAAQEVADRLAGGRGGLQVLQIVGESVEAGDLGPLALDDQPGQLVDPGFEAGDQSDRLLAYVLAGLRCLMWRPASL